MAPNSSARRISADLSLAFICIIWGATFVVVKDAVARASVLLFLALRFTLAALILTPLQGRALRTLRSSDLLAGARLGLFMFGGYAFQTFGLIFTTPAKSGILTGSSAVFVPILLALFWRSRLRVPDFIGAGAAVVGLYLLTAPSGRIAALNVGDVLTLIAAVLYAIHIILAGQYTRTHRVAALSFLQTAATALLAAVICAAAAFAGWQPLRFERSWQLGGAIFITAVFATAFAFTVQLWAQRYTSASHAAILFTLEPVFAAITSYLVLGERLRGRALAGATLVVAGICLAELKGPAAAPESPEPASGAA